VRRGLSLARPARVDILRRRPLPANGCARALARIHPVLAELDCAPCRLALTSADELDLRDCTEAQLGISGVCAARAPMLVWRRFLIAHFERYLVEATFGADVLHADALDASSGHARHALASMRREAPRHA
jgi:hypothetical protein